ncbi:hypothetical protein [Luteolibacter soli]|uniref:Uncharacterized protein n=1 Tax=Luteolibacter soli TaxID=3135280 RepID=A0ABU9B016_9BACT
MRKTAKFADPFLWGPLTGGLGCIVVRSMFGDAEIKGFAARVLASFQLLLGTAFLAILISDVAVTSRFRKGGRVAMTSTPGLEMAYLPADESGSASGIIPPPPPALPAPAPKTAQASAAAPEEAPAITPTSAVEPVAAPPASQATAATKPASTPAPATHAATPSSTKPQQPTAQEPAQPGSITRMPKGWMPEGIELRKR